MFKGVANGNVDEGAGPVGGGGTAKVGTGAVVGGGETSEEPDFLSESHNVLLLLLVGLSADSTTGFSSGSDIILMMN